jgi:hypothetical protein
MDSGGNTSPIDADHRHREDGRGNARPQGLVAGLTAKALSCTAKAHVPKPMRHAACLHVSRAMQAA